MIADEEGLLTTLVLSIYDLITAVCAESQTFEKRFFLTMTLYQFNAMDEMEQAEAIWSGTHIGDRQDDQHDILLYQIDGLFQH